MEENLHEHKMDDYVRKSFEEYEEAPPSDMWDRVEGAMEEGPKRPSIWMTFRRMGWQLMAAGIILVLTSTLICEHLFYQEKIRQLTQLPSSVQPIGQKEHPGNIEVAEKVEKSRTVIQESDLVEKGKNEMATKKERVSSFKPKPLDSRREGMIDKDGTIPNPANLMAPIQSAQSSSASIIYHETSLMETLEAPEPIEWRNIIVYPSELQVPSQLTVAAPELISTVVSAPIIRPSHSNSGWFSGIETSIMHVSEKAQTAVSRPGRPTFSSQSGNRSISSITWLKAGKQWLNPWSVETGLGYQQISKTAIHNPRFRFGDGVNSGSPQNPRRNFSYDLSTSSGNAEVSLRMEQTTPGSTSDDEPIRLRIETAERSTWIRVPLLLGYHWGNGRWKGVVKSGLLGSFLVQNQFELSTRVSENARFKPVEGRDGYTLTLDNHQIKMGYLASAGAGFRLGRCWQLGAEATVAGDFPYKDAFKRKLPSQLFAGVNLGLTYYF
jgi:hypothetical protein